VGDLVSCQQSPSGLSFFYSPLFPTLHFLPRFAQLKLVCLLVQLVPFPLALFCILQTALLEVLALAAVHAPPAPRTAAYGVVGVTKSA